jgi:hypothetical protein
MGFSERSFLNADAVLRAAAMSIVETIRLPPIRSLLPRRLLHLVPHKAAAIPARPGIAPPAQNVRPPVHLGPVRPGVVPRA